MNGLGKNSPDFLLAAQPDDSKDVHSNWNDDNDDTTDNNNENDDKRPGPRNPEVSWGGILGPWHQKSVGPGKARGGPREYA